MMKMMKSELNKNLVVKNVEDTDEGVFEKLI